MMTKKIAASILAAGAICVSLSACDPLTVTSQTSSAAPVSVATIPADRVVPATSEAPENTSKATSVEDIFVTVIRSKITSGISNDDQSVIDAGRAVCSVLDLGATLNETVAMLSKESGLNYSDASYFTGASISAFCPNHSDMVG